jgi:hypothetical protein
MRSHMNNLWSFEKHKKEKSEYEIKEDLSQWGQLPPSELADDTKIPKHATDVDSTCLFQTFSQPQTKPGVHKLLLLHTKVGAN